MITSSICDVVYIKAKNKGRFRSDHEAEIILYEAARKYLKKHAADGTLPSYVFLDTEAGKFPNIAKVKSIRSALISEQKQIRDRRRHRQNSIEDD